MKLSFKNIKDKFSLADLKRIFKKILLVVIEKIDWIFFFLLALDIVLGVLVFYNFTFLIQSQEAGEIASLKIYSLQGNLVRTLLRGSLSRGSHSILWDGRNDFGEPVSSGVYLYRLTAGAEQSVTQKMILLK